MNLPTHPGPGSTSSAPAAPDDSQALLSKLALGLALLTFLIYLPVIGYTFVNYDDDVFVTNNKMVAPGFTWAGVKWAFSTADIDYWRPLSWLSHMLDMELFGLVGGMHHLHNLLIHIAATVMLLLALHRLTRALWPSAVVAALFAWHPLHVESVAWVAERKDVLCGFFWFYTLWAYARYVEQPTSRRYLPVLVGFALGVMSKPMIMTLPCVLMLLDFWPLRRSELLALADWRQLGWQGCVRNVWAVLKDKVPLFATVLILGLSTVTSQHEVGTVMEVPLLYRVINGISAYGIYVAQTFWPADLCVLYLLKFPIPVWKWGGALLAGLVFTTGFLVLARRCSYLIVGWLWFLGVLFPVLGVVRQVGEQGHADRYTYVPSVGLFVAFVWLLFQWAANHAVRQRWVAWGLGVALLGCAVLTRQQVTYWEDSVTLFRRAASVDPTNITALNNVAAELIAINETEAAIPVLEQALKVKRTPGLLWQLAMCLMGRGEFERAQALTAEAFSPRFSGPTVVRLTQTVRTYLNYIIANAGPQPPGSDDKSLTPYLAQHEGPVRKVLATALAGRGDYQGASEHLTHAIRLKPDDINAQIDNAAYLAMLGKDEAAILQLRTAAVTAPTNSLALSNLGALLAKRGQHQEAIQHYRTALAVEPDNPDTRHNFAIALIRNGQPLDAKREFDEVIRRNPKHQPATQQLAWLLATNVQSRDPRRALTLAKTAAALRRTAYSLDTLAAAQATNGNFEQAVAIAGEALSLARTEKLAPLEKAIFARLQGYRARQAYAE